MKGYLIIFGLFALSVGYTDVINYKDDGGLYVHFCSTLPTKPKYSIGIMQVSKDGPIKPGKISVYGSDKKGLSRDNIPDGTTIAFIPPGFEAEAVPQGWKAYTWPKDKNARAFIITDTFPTTNESDPVEAIADFEFKTNFKFRTETMPAKTFPEAEKGVWTIIGPIQPDGSFSCYQIYHPGKPFTTRIDLGDGYQKAHPEHFQINSK